MLTGVLGLIIVGLLAITFPIFVRRHRNAPADPDLAGRQATALLGRRIREWMVWVLAPVERWLVRGGVSPDLLNWLGLALGVAAGLAFAAGNPGLAGWLLAAGGICDILDGRLARALNVASRYGAFVDSTLDRFAETATLLGVAWYLKSSPGLMLWAMLALAGSLLVSYARARGQALGVDFAGGVMQRAERVVLLTLGALLEASLVDRMGWARGTVMGAIVIMVALGTLGTAVYRAMVTGDRLRRAGND